jgi:hypothetical protein
MAEKKTIELDVKSNLGSLKSQLKQAQQEVQTLADKFGATSAEAIQAAKRAAELKDRIGDAKSLTDAFNPDAKFKALSGSLTGVASGFSAVTGAMGLFGQQNEDVEKALLKVQSAMALSQGLQGLGEARDTFKQLGGVIRDAAVKLGILTVTKQADVAVTAEQAIAQAASVGATEAQAVANATAGTSFKIMGVAAKTSLNGVKGAIAATGIGLLVVALGTIVAYWDDIKGLVSGVTAEQSKQYESQKLLTEEAKLQYDAFDASVNSLKLQGKSEKEIIKLRKNKLFILLQENKQDISNAEAKTKLEVEGAKRNQSYAKLYMRIQLETMAISLRAVAAPIDLMMISINKALSLLGMAEIKMKPINSYITDMTTAGAEAFGKLLFDPEAIALEGKKTVNELKGVYNANKSSYDGLRLEIIEIDKNANDKALEGNQEKLDKLKAQEEEYQQSIKDAKKNILNETLTQDEIEINAVKEKYQKQLDLAKSLKKDTAVIEEAMGIEINAIRKKYAEDLETLPMLPIAPIKVAATELVGIAKKATQEELDAFVTLAETKMAIRDADFENASAGINLISKLFEGNKKVQAASLIAENALAIAKTIIATKASNQAARASGTALSIASAGASVVTAEALVLRNNIGAGISIAGIIAATGKGLSALKAGGAPTGGDTGGNTGGGGGGGNSVMSANFNVVGNSGLNQLGQLQQRPTKAYVVSGDMSTAQSLDRNRIENATLVQ